MNTDVMTATELAATLKKSMPETGIMNRNKRLMAYAYITAFASGLIKNQRLASEALERLRLICKDFHVAMTETARIISTISRHETDILCPLGWALANKMAVAHGWQASPDYMVRKKQLLFAY